MSITNGPNLGLMVNGNAGEGHYSQFMAFLRGVDGLVMPSVKGYLTNTPPASPADGDCYIIGAAPTGAWAGQGGKVARYSTVAAAWEYYTPKNGWMIEANSARESYRYTGGAWEIYYQEGTWTSVIAGDVTPGTYEINTSLTFNNFTKVGRLVAINSYIVLAASITGGGSGDLKITGLPFSKRANSSSWGSIAMSGITYSSGKQITPYFGTTASSSYLMLWESASATSVTLTQISGVHASNVIAFSIFYET